MPRFVFTGLVSTTYPETRDAQDRPLGLVEPGDEREFDTAPDHQWAPADGQDESAPEPEPEPAPEPAADGPQPAPPAIIPGQ